MQDIKTCRICLQTTNDDGGGDRWVSPCQCKGSQAYVHQGCLTTWRTHSKPNRDRCQVCTNPYDTSVAPMSRSPPRSCRDVLFSIVNGMVLILAISAIGLLAVFHWIVVMRWFLKTIDNEVLPRIREWIENRVH